MPKKRPASKPLALVIEDDVDASTVATAMLQILGFETRPALDAQQALSILSTTKPDLVLLDICLPDLSGESVLRILRRLAEHATTPVLAVSAVYPHDNPITKRMREHGILGYLPKPFTFGQLREKLDQVLPQGWLRESGAAPLPAEPAPAVAEQPPPVTPPVTPPRRLTRVRAQVSHLSRSFEAIVERGDEASVVARLSQRARTGDQLQLRFQDDKGDRYARIRMRATVEQLMDGKQQRYRLRVDLVTPPREWTELCELLGRVLDATDTGEWTIAE